MTQWQQQDVGLESPWRKPGPAARAAMVCAGLVVLAPLLLLAALVLAAVVVGLVVFVTLATVARVVTVARRILRAPFEGWGEGGRRNVRVIRR